MTSSGAARPVSLARPRRWPILGAVACVGAVAEYVLGVGAVVFACAKPNPGFTHLTTIGVGCVLALLAAVPVLFAWRARRRNERFARVAVAAVAASGVAAFVTGAVLAAKFE